MTEWTHEDEAITELLRRVHAAAPVPLAVTREERDLIEQSTHRHIAEARRRGRPIVPPTTDHNDRSNKMPYTDPLANRDDRPPDQRAELRSAFRGAAPGRGVPYHDVESIADGLDPKAFVDHKGHVVFGAVRKWCETNIGPREGASVQQAEHVAAFLDRGAAWSTPDLPPIEWTTSAHGLEGLLYGYEEGDDV